MRISRIEIFGFKSFMERFVLNFDEPMIGIVGPNGCGKSNIVDALRWVLGETHAKQLRGSVLDDIIFNGSDSRRPLGMAEVSITIRPDEGWFEAKQSEEEARVRDLVAQADASLSDEERELVQSEDSERGDEPQVDEDVVRSSLAKLQEVVPGLFEAAEIQLTRRLYRSGESEYFINRVPCRLRDLIDFYRTIGLGARGLSIVQQGQIGELISKKPTERRQLLEEAAGIAGFRVRIEAATRQLARTNDNIARLSDIIAEVDKQVRVLKRQANRAKRRDELKDNLRTSDLAVFEHKAARIIGKKDSVGQQQQSLEQNIDESESKVNVLRAEEERTRALLEELEVELSDLRRKKEALSTEIHHLVEERTQAQLAKAQLEGQLEGVRERLRSIDERKETIGVEMQRRKEAIDAARVQRDRYEGELQQLDSRLSGEAGVVGELPELEAQLGELNRSISETEGRAKFKQLERASLKGEIESLEQQLAQFQPVETEGDLSRLCENGAVSALFDSVRVSEEYSAAFAAVVSDRTVYVIGDSRPALRARFEELGVSAEGFGAVSRELAEQAAANLLPAPAGSKRLIDCVQVEGADQGALAAIIGNVFVVEDLSSGFQAMDALGGLGSERRVRAVTKAGQVVTPWGWFSSGASGSIYSSHARLESKREHAARIERDVDVLLAEIANLKQEHAAASEKAAALRAERERIAAEQRAAASELAEIRASIAQYAGQMRFEEQRIEELRAELGELEKKRETLIESERRLREQNAEASAFAQSQSTDFEKEHELLDQQHELTKVINDKDTRREDLRLELSELLHKVETARRLRENLQHEHGEITLSVDRLALELSMLHDDIKQRYGDSVKVPTTSESEEILNQAGGITNIAKTIAELEEESTALRQKLEREGDVDPEAVFLCRKEEERLTELETQRTDLQRAVGTLERTVRQLKDVSRKRFLYTFESVNEKFKELVPRLFGGGAGYMELVDPEDPLTSGVELTVRPPGKKLRSMELMSGGEKALSATAVLIAMFLHRPSPICVLDEVDAPLDDANVTRFCDL
ncbi:MAG: AAA family ATPase, partial [Bdellovibrionales bacterium]|nr:AAA family ATPase [Bdellovibrionales bacterium]